MFDIVTRDIKYLQGVGPQRAAVLNKELGIYYMTCSIISPINMWIEVACIISMR